MAEGPDIIFTSVVIQHDILAGSLSFGLCIMFKANSYFGEKQLLIEHAVL